MNNFYISIRIIAVFIFFTIGSAYGQADTLRVDSPKVKPPKAAQLNAGFDVIIKLDGDIVYGLVKEVGLYLISYQRTDIPDGPIYTLPRNTVYAISYRNQLKEIINPLSEAPPLPVIDSGRQYIDYRRHDLFRYGSAFLGAGFLQGFSKVDDKKNYASSGSFPVISFGYDVNFKNNSRLGVLLGFGSHNFSKQEFSSYDSTQNDITLKENIFGLYVYGKYYLLNNTSRIQPYVMGGVGITSSHIRSDNKISFTNDNTQVILVKSGTRSAGLNILARIGAQYYISDQLQVFADAGIGLSVINIGLSFSVN